MNGARINEAEVLQALREVIDPEMGIDIVALGLIYDIAIRGGRVDVKMTLTMPGCPMHDSITSGAQLALLNLDGVDDAHVDLVWDPPWHPGMMESAAETRIR
jgi:metal-sulfur cluster biosynthetic enzyme